MNRQDLWYMAGFLVAAACVLVGVWGLGEAETAEAADSRFWGLGWFVVRATSENIALARNVFWAVTAVGAIGCGLCLIKLALSGRE